MKRVRGKIETTHRQNEKGFLEQEGSEKIWLKKKKTDLKNRKYLDRASDRNALSQEKKAYNQVKT